MPKRFCTEKDLVEMGVGSLSTVKRYVKAGLIPSTRIGRKRLILLDEFEGVVEKNRTKPSLINDGYGQKELVSECVLNVANARADTGLVDVGTLGTPARSGGISNLNAEANKCHSAGLLEGHLGDICGTFSSDLRNATPRDVLMGGDAA